MKKIIIIALLSVIFSGALLDQSVYKQDGSFVIECKGMPVGSYTNDAKPRDENKLKLEANNLKVYYKFEVQGADQGGEGAEMNWSDAHTICRDLGGTWRLPTHRELHLIWVLHEGLKKLDGFTDFGEAIYWNASERSTLTNFAWSVDFTPASGNTTSYNKANPYRVRCIREL